LLLLFVAAGCQAPSIPDPNDPANAGPNLAHVVQADLKSVNDAANRMVVDQQITPDQAKVLINQYEAGLCRGLDITKVSPEDAYIFGQIFLDAKDWEDARKVLTVAVKAAKTEDRRINDTLRLAQVYAELGDIDKAIEVARFTYTTNGNDKAPILPGVLFGVVPAGQGKGKDAELAKLLEDAIRQHEQVVINPSLESGKLFLSAKPILISRAWREVIRLYEASGHPNLADKARQSEQAAEPTRLRV
jgi:hypothetical protein